jgi:hypothetical protein
MKFNPVLLDNLFSEDDIIKLKNLVASQDYKNSWNDKNNSRGVKKYIELEEYFSKKLEPVAKKVFGDDTLKTTYSVYLDYNKPTAKLDMHRDNNACRYTIDYCVSAKTPWGFVIEDTEHVLLPGQGLAFMGGYDAHGRKAMPDPENNRVEVIMFHFCPEDHWYFTEGPDYIYTLEEQGLLGDFDSYDLSPKLNKKPDKS